MSTHLRFAVRVLQQNRRVLDRAIAKVVANVTEPYRGMTVTKALAKDLRRRLAEELQKAGFPACEEEKSS